MIEHFPYPHTQLPDAIKWPTRIFLFSLCLLTFGIMLHPLVDPDVYIHLRDGRHWLESGFQVAKDPFSYTASDQPFEKVEWLFRALLYSAWKVGGYSLLIILKALVMTLAFWYFAGLLYRRWPNLGATGALLGLSVLMIWTRIAPERPQMFTYLLLPLCLHLLEDFRLAKNPSGREAKKLWLLPLLVVPWANLHPGFTVLFVFLAAHALENLWKYVHSRRVEDRQRLTRLLAIALACFLAGCLTLDGFGIYTFVANAAGNNLFLQTIVEWMPPELDHKPVFFLMLAFSGLALLFSLRRARLSDVLPWAVFSYLALKSRRNIPLFVLASLPPLAEYLRYLKNEWFANLTLTFNQRRNWLLLGNGILLAILLVTLVTGYSFRLGFFPDYHPQDGLQWMQAHKLQGRLFAPLHWGGYIGWETHGKIKVFMDGRLPTFAGKVFDDYTHIIYGDSQCLSCLDEYGIQIILVSPKNYFSLFQQLAASGQWVLVYWDHVSQVFVRKSGPNREIADEFAYQYVDPNATPFSNPASPEKAMQEIERARLAAPNSYLPLFFKGDLLLQANKFEEARAILEQVLIQQPNHAFTLLDLGTIAMQTGDFPQAEKYFKQALPQNPDKSFQAKTCLYLASVVKQNPLRRSEALGYAQQALCLLPGWPQAQQLIRELEY